MESTAIQELPLNLVNLWEVWRRDVQGQGELAVQVAANTALKFNDGKLEGSKRRVVAVLIIFWLATSLDASTTCISNCIWRYRASVGTLFTGNFFLKSPFPASGQPLNVTQSQSLVDIPQRTHLL